MLVGNWAVLRVLNSWINEGLIPRAKLLLILGGTFFLAFWPLILVTIVVFLAIYLRYKIAVGIAKGIAYLHHDCFSPIIHRDIKSTSILLDKGVRNESSDFGWRKFQKFPLEVPSSAALQPGTAI